MCGLFAISGWAQVLLKNTTSVHRVKVCACVCVLIVPSKLLDPIAAMNPALDIAWSWWLLQLNWQITSDHPSQVLTTALSSGPALDWHLDLNPGSSLARQRGLLGGSEGGGRTTAFQASQQRRTVLEPVVSGTSWWMAMGRYRWAVEEEVGLPGSGLLQQGMEEAPTRERSKEVKAGSCRPCGAAGKPGTDHFEEEKENGLSGQEIYGQTHWRSLKESQYKELDDESNPSVSEKEFFINCVRLTDRSNRLV